MTELHEAGVLRFDLTGISLDEFEEVSRPLRPPYYIAHLKLKMVLNGTNLQAALRWQQRTIDEVFDIPY